jgi:hypothetical protein
MASGFETHNLLKSASNYPVAKGDLPGHAFHGNQHVAAPFSSSNPLLKGATTIGQASEQLTNTIQKAPEGVTWHGVDIPQTYWQPGEYADPYAKFDHQQASDAHNEIATALEKVGTPEAIVAATAHREAAAAHDLAVEKHTDLWNRDADDDSHYQEAEQNADSYSRRADAYTKDINGGKYNPDLPRSFWYPIIPGQPQPVEI